MKTNLKPPLIIAHRGASGTFPENTLEACWGAIASNCDIIEVDLQLTKDRNIVLFHDRTVHRIFDQHLTNKSIKDYELHELRQKDVGSWFDASFHFCKLVTLEELFQSLPKDYQMILEMKSREDELILKTSEFLLENKINLGKGYISVRDLDSYDLVKSQVQSTYRIGLMQKKTSAEDFIKLIDNERISVVQIRPDSWNETDFEILQTLPIEIMVFYADTFEKYSEFCDKNVTGILTNFPQRLRAFILKRIKESSL